ncbi:hypothetical protein [Pedobacter sp. WC2423]|uniref:hypothetical protein n=1 Tax=Pedobacter sp. WC2423 TaxID=3234142 RepID=UPI003467D471
MKTLNTLLGQVIIHDARIVLAPGQRGRYTILVDIELEGKTKELNVHSTDSELYDKAHGESNHSEIVLKDAEYTIEKAVNHFINSL